MENSEKSQFESEPWYTASKKFRELGPLGVTAEDHLKVGSTPPQLLVENPGKTYIDLLSDEEIATRLGEWCDDVEAYSGDEYRENTFVQGLRKSQIEDLRTSIKYLRSLNRLPKEFENYPTVG